MAIKPIVHSEVPVHAGDQLLTHFVRGLNEVTLDVALVRMDVRTSSHSEHPQVLGRISSHVLILSGQRYLRLRFVPLQDSSRPSDSEHIVANEVVDDRLRLHFRPLPYGFAAILARLLPELAVRAGPHSSLLPAQVWAAALSRLSVEHFDLSHPLPNIVQRSMHLASIPPLSSAGETACVEFKHPTKVYHMENTSLTSRLLEYVTPAHLNSGNRIDFWVGVPDAQRRCKFTDTCVGFHWSRGLGPDGLEALHDTITRSIATLQAMIFPALPSHCVIPEVCEVVGTAPSDWKLGYTAYDIQRLDLPANELERLLACIRDDVGRVAVHEQAASTTKDVEVISLEMAGAAEEGGSKSGPASDCTRVRASAMPAVEVISPMVVPSAPEMSFHPSCILRSHFSTASAFQRCTCSSLFAPSTRGT
jgi:hypothetical protein